MLGYGGRVGAVERWRVNVGVGTLAHYGGGQLVMSGHQGEAERLAALAPPGVDVALEITARTTWENVERSLPLLEGVHRLAIASDYFHERRAARYLEHLDPSLAGRLVSPERRWRDGWWIHISGGVYAAVLWLRLRTSQRRRSSNPA